MTHHVILEGLQFNTLMLVQRRYSLVFVCWASVFLLLFVQSCLLPTDFKGFLLALAASRCS